MPEYAERTRRESAPAPRAGFRDAPAGPGTLRASLQQAPRVQALAQLREAFQESPRVQELAELRDALQAPVQRVVPTAPGLPKPAADVQDYNPQGGNKIFRSEDYPRRAFTFQAVTKRRVIEKSDPVIVDGQVTQVRANGNLVPLAGAQMDHTVSWDSIAQVMDQHNAQMDLAGAPLSSYYTLRDARLYYNDVSNLHFVLGAHNAAAGAAGVPVIEDVHADFRAPTGFIAGEWQNLQQMLHAVSGGVTPEQAAAVFDRLAELGAQMREAYRFVEGMVQTGQGGDSIAMDQT